MAKKKKRSGGGGQPQKPAEPAEEGDEQAVDNDAASGEAPAEDSNDKDKEKGKAQDDKDNKSKDQQDGKDNKGKKPPPPLPVVTAVLKVDMHCDGCAKRIRASVHRYAGVEGVAMEVDKGTMTVVGRFDAKKLRDRVAKKTKKKVDLVGNNNKGGGGGGGNNNKGGGGGGGNQHKQGAGEEDGKPEKEHDGGGQGHKGNNDKDDHQEEKDKGNKDNKGGGGGGGDGGGKGKGKDNKKPAVPVISTVVLKIGSTGLHCEGCMNRIRSKLFKIKGVEQVKMDMSKNQVTVTGTMDAKALPEKLRKKLRRPVDVVTAKDGGKDKDGKQQQEGGGGKDKDAATKALTAELEAWKAAFYDQQSLTNAEFMLSDENPNACVVM